jgi:hypothetical protein
MSGKSSSGKSYSSFTSTSKSSSVKTSSSVSRSKGGSREKNINNTQDKTDLHVAGRGDWDINIENFSILYEDPSGWN